VIFDEFAYDDDPKVKWKCPVKIRTVDSVCLEKGYENSDPAVICRRAGDYVGPSSLKKIKWVAQDGVPFAVTFPSGVSPCKGSWDGGTYQTVHVCQLKNAADLNLKTDDAVFLKYDISVEDKRCGDPLDPYFIVRK
jgi:hypothetical protein